VHLGTVLQKDKELVRNHVEKQLLLTAVTLILTRFRQLSNRCRLILICQLTPSTDWTLMIMCEIILLRNLFTLLWPAP